MENTQQYKVIGLMSGTSLDGLDIAACEFRHSEGKWQFTLRHAETLEYPASWRKKLMGAHQMDAASLMELDSGFGIYLGEAVRSFSARRKFKPDFIASHGHTVFHQPSKGFTTQIGNGQAIHAASGMPVIYDFRTLDVLLGGQGAPLVPIGDRLLFPDYDVCLNLGGIANLSMDVKGKRVAFDVCFVNMALNQLAGEQRKKFDNKGNIAASGEIHQPLLRTLRSKYQKLRGKRPSLGREIFERDFFSAITNSSIALNDRMRTVTESIAMELTEVIREMKGSSVLCTGGGAFNSFLISRMLELGGDEVSWVIPDDDIVKFKEAIVFAFLGVLRSRGEVNCLRSVTGASRDCSGGVLAGF